MKTYNPVLIERARTMRKEMTAAEFHLWQHCLRDFPVKFRRQRPFGHFIVDFYCPPCKLVVEIDGEIGREGVTPLGPPCCTGGMPIYETSNGDVTSPLYNRGETEQTRGGGSGWF